MVTLILEQNKAWLNISDSAISLPIFATPTTQNNENNKALLSVFTPLKSPLNVSCNLMKYSPSKYEQSSLYNAMF
jgi:hypothetical protein